jgi:alpha-tubulin suppressor-like RCC1 family protein
MNWARYGVDDEKPAKYGGPLDVPPDLVGGVVGVAAGYSHSMVLLSDGSVRVWGGDADGTQVSWCRQNKGQ